jgi:hypothetical protein
MKRKLLIGLLLIFLSTNVFAKQYILKYHFQPKTMFSNRENILDILEFTLSDIINKGYKIVSFTIKSNNNIDDGFIIVYEDDDESNKV